MGVFDTILAEVDGKEVELQTKWRLFFVKGKGICAEVYNIRKTPYGADLWIEGYAVLDPLRDKVDLPDYDWCALNTYRVGDIIENKWRILEVDVGIAAAFMKVEGNICEEKFAKEDTKWGTLLVAEIEDVGRVEVVPGDTAYYVKIYFREKIRLSEEKKAEEKIIKALNTLFENWNLVD